MEESLVCRAKMDALKHAQNIDCFAKFVDDANIN